MNNFTVEMDNIELQKHLSDCTKLLRSDNVRSFSVEVNLSSQYPDYSLVKYTVLYI